MGLPIGTITFELHLVCRIMGGFDEVAELLVPDVGSGGAPVDLAGAVRRLLTDAA